MKEPTEIWKKMWTFFFWGYLVPQQTPATPKKCKISTKNFSKTKNAIDFKFSRLVSIYKIQVQLKSELIWPNRHWETIIFGTRAKKGFGSCPLDQVRMGHFHWHSNCTCLLYQLRCGENLVIGASLIFEKFSVERQKSWIFEKND